MTNDENEDQLERHSFIGVSHKGTLEKIEFNAGLGVWVVFVKVKNSRFNSLSDTYASFYVLDEELVFLSAFLGKEINIKNSPVVALVES